MVLIKSEKKNFKLICYDIHENVLFDLLELIFLIFKF